MHSLCCNKPTDDDEQFNILKIHVVKFFDLTNITIEWLIIKSWMKNIAVTCYIIIINFQKDKILLFVSMINYYYIYDVMINKKFLIYKIVR